MRIGILGGSFNPAHDGHRHISLAALARLRLDAVWWLVSPQNPLKPTLGMAAQSARLDRAIGVARHPHIAVTGIETALGTRFTAATLIALRRRFPRARFVWLMGADNLAQIPRWDRWISIFHQVPIAIFDRSPYAFRALAGKAAHRFKHARRPPGPALATDPPPAWTFVHLRCHPASATALRQAGAANGGHRLEGGGGGRPGEE